MKLIWSNLAVLLLLNNICLSFQQFTSDDPILSPSPPPRCGLNEVHGVLNTCGDLADLCSSIGINCDMITLYPSYGCVCKPGFARLYAKGPCVDIKSPLCSFQYRPSPLTCANRPRRPNEMYLANGPGCQETCGFYGVPCDPKQNPSSGCYCKPNFLREYEDSECIPIDNSRCQFKIPSKEACERRFEEYIENGSPCQTTCANYGKRCHIKSPKPVNACYCPEGKARQGGSRGWCVPVDSEECVAERA